MVKLRLIVSGKRDKVNGLTVSQETANFFSGCYFNEIRSGTAIIFESGANIKITKKDVIDYKFEDVRI